LLNHFSSYKKYTLSTRGAKEKRAEDSLRIPDIGNKQRDLYIIWLKMKGNIGTFSTRVDKKGLKFDLATCTGSLIMDS
ncbi:unnamed protein product, partial [Larinioides sclopetarius]